MDNNLIVFSKSGDILEKISTSINNIFSSSYCAKKEIYLVGGDSKKICIIQNKVITEKNIHQYGCCVITNLRKNKSVALGLYSNAICIIQLSPFRHLKILKAHSSSVFHI